jgi:hypothetical protein
MAVSIKTTPELVRPAGSHHLSLEQGRAEYGPFSKEELYPILELEAPRVGFIRAQFSADRYVASNGWSEWRIYLRDVRTPDAERPDLPHLGRDAAGIGDATRRAISEACEPLIRAWLATDAYKVSRRRAAARAVANKIGAPAEWAIENGRRLLVAADSSLDPIAVKNLREALEALELARVRVDIATAGD